MKKTNFLLLIAAGICYFMITGYKDGPGTHWWDCTGAETGLGNPSGCNANGCHSASATTGITLTIEFDSAGVPTTHYKGGMNYSVKLTGTNNTSSSLPKFGFQMVSIKGASAVTTPSNIGTWTTPLPTNTHIANPQSTFFVVRLVEHSVPLAPATGTGGNGTTYSKTFNWLAPDTGTGTVSIWAALNAVNGNNSQDVGDKWNTNHLIIDEWVTSTPANGLASLEQNLFKVNISPNPFSNIAELRIQNAELLDKNDNLQFMIYDLSGRVVFQSAIRNSQSEVQRGNLSNGIYFYQIKNEKEIVATGKLVVSD